MRFSIRDLLWATALVAMGLGWWSEYRAKDVKRLEAVGQAQRLRATLLESKEATDKLLDKFAVGGAVWRPMLNVDWSVLDEPLVEP